MRQQPTLELTPAGDPASAAAVEWWQAMLQHPETQSRLGTDPLGTLRVLAGVLKESGRPAACALADEQLAEIDTLEAEHPELIKTDAQRRPLLAAAFSTPLDESALSGLRTPSTSARTAPRARSSRRRPGAVASAGRQQRDVDRPRQCGCGCGEPLPRGKRKYVNNTHAARQQQRDHRARQKQLGTPPLNPEQQELRWWWLERFTLEELHELGRMLWPEPEIRELAEAVRR
jgi:hypothetical protein